jgi:DNA repair protein RadD
MIALRPYQQEAVDAVFDFWSNGGGSPLVDLATGLGKSVVIAKLTRDLMEGYPSMRALMLVHVRELVEQNYRALIRLWPDAPAGIYSAGLGKRDAHHRITFASIQSVYKKARALGPRDVVLIDETHLVPAEGDGMYRRLLEDLRQERPDLRIVGFTATPFRMDSGRLDKGGLFDQTVYSYGIGAGIRDGWLSPLISKASATEIDVSGVAKRGGEFVAGALEAAADDADVTRAAAAEMLRYGHDRRSWLVFCTGIKHAAHVRDAIRALGISAETVTGDTPPMERARIIAAFKAGHIRALTNAQVLTTGFDAPATDLIAFLRPTLSTGLYIQMVGRGTRKAEGKDNALILDFAGNVRRHGPVDIATIDRGPPKSKSEDEETKVKVDSVRAKTCPSCEALVGIRAAECPHCHHVWPVTEKPKHEATAEIVPILSTEIVKPTGIEIYDWRAARHSKVGAPDSLRVTYMGGIQAHSEWICFEHTGFARQKAEVWWRKHQGGFPPATVTEALERFNELVRPATIEVRINGRYPEIVGRTFKRSEAA